MVEEIILKAKNDKREYRRIVLQNSLEVVLISDPDTDKCAASMNVEVGSFSDPPDLQGLAHFVEHMLFYASEKYPSESGFSKYITEHGGGWNAFTSRQYTNYHFDVTVDSFEEALDRFAQFFIKPLISEDAITREVNAVDSEYQKKRLSDSIRLKQLQKHLSEASHPYHNFITGNKDTLKTQPKANGVDIRHEVIKFYERNYSANLMHLVVYGKDSLNAIQNIVYEKFQNIRNTGQRCYRFPTHPCSSGHLQILVRAVPVRDNHTLKVQWPITPTIGDYKEGPCVYISNLIGHEGEGTLFHVLKKLGWTTSLSATSDESSEFSFFTVAFNLTDAGAEHMQDVIGLLYRYIRLIRETGVCKWIFDEISALSQTMFDHQDKMPPCNYVIPIAQNMKYFPPEDWLVRSSVPCKFSPTIIKTILEEISLNNCRIFFMSKKFEGETNTIEPWYGTAFSVDKLIDSTIEAWMLAAPKKTLSLPVPNHFIPTNLSLKNIEKNVEFPVLLRKGPFSVLWYKPDTAFFVPKASIQIKFHCTNACSSPEATVLTTIFTSLINDYLNEYGYYAELASLYYSISGTDSGFQVSVRGYSHKLRILLETILDNIAAFEVKPDRFSVIKEKLIKKCRNFNFWEPVRHASYYCSQILNDQAWSLMEQLEILPTIKEEDLCLFVRTMLSRCFLECSVVGNVEASEAESMIKHVEDQFFRCADLPLCKPLLPSQYLTNRVVELKMGKPYLYSTLALNPNDENSALIHYIQVHRDDFRMNVKLQLIDLIAKQQVFHQLRTVEQLGYTASLQLRSDSGVYGLEFTVQSTSKSPKHIDSRVQAFLKMFENKMHEMKDDDFKSKVSALIDLKLEKFRNLREESGFFWEEITNGTLKFNRANCEVEELRRITRAELIHFFDEYIKVGASKKRSLSVRVYGSRHSSEFAEDNVESDNNSMYRIADIVRFRRSLPLYGSFGGCFDQVKPYRISTELV